MLKPETEPEPAPTPAPAPKPYIPVTAAEKRRAEEIEKLVEKQKSFKLEGIDESLGDAIDSKFTMPKKREVKK